MDLTSIHEETSHEPPHPLAVIRSGAFIYRNPAFEAIIGSAGPAELLCAEDGRSLAAVAASVSAAGQWRVVHIAGPDRALAVELLPGAGEDGEPLVAVCGAGHVKAGDRLRAAESEIETRDLLIRAGRMLAAAVGTDATLRVLAEAVQASLGRRRVTVALFDPSREYVEHRWSTVPGIPPGTVWRVAEMHEGYERATRERLPAVIDYEAPSGRPYRERPARIAMRLLLVVPLVADGEVLGFFGIDEPGGREPFSEKDVRVAEGIASQAGVAVAVARLHDERERSAKLGEDLNGILEVLHCTPDADEVLGSVVSMAARSLSATCCAVYASDRFGRWRAVATMPAGRERLLEWVAHMTVESPHPLLACPAPCPERDFRSAAILVPLRSAGMEPAALLFESAPDAAGFDEAAVQFARRLGASLSLALRNSERYRVEHRVSQTLQSALLALPSEVDGVRVAHAYRSATEAARIGGDFYDVFEIEPGLVAILIGDVSGKGLDAASLTAMVRSVVRSHCYELGGAPAAVLERVNRTVYRESPLETFVTAFFGVLDLGAGVLRYCNAGHTTCFVRSGGRLRSLPANSPLVGAFRDLTFAEADQRVEAGDILLLYTDGLIEARGEGGLFGETRLSEAVLGSSTDDPEELISMVLTSVLEFSRQTLTDDVALLALRMQPPAELHEAAAEEASSGLTPSEDVR